jgi:uncharacterized protein
MTSPYAELIDVGVLTSQMGRLQREFALASFERLADRLERSDGRATVELRVVEVGEFPALEGTLSAWPWLVCQRCLEPFAAVLDAQVRVAFVASDADAERLPDTFEPVELDAGRFDLHAIVEDELLLALPLVPMHATAAECANAQVVIAEEKSVEPKKDSPTHRPFGDLRALLKR